MASTWNFVSKLLFWAFVLVVFGQITYFTIFHQNNATLVLPPSDEPAVTRGSIAMSLTELLISKPVIGGVSGKTFENRRAHASKACFNYFGFDGESFERQLREIDLQKLSKAFYNFTFYDDRFKILFCTIPKVASTNIKELLVDLLDRPILTWPPNVNKQKKVPHIRRLAELTADQVMERLQRYTKILFVRHPIERLISSWRDKFSRGAPQENPKLIPHFNRILKSYRSSPVELDAPTLEEFLRYIVTEGTLANVTDEHWRPYVDHCNPCQVDYDYIGHFENLEPELNYIAQVTTKQGIRGVFPKPAAASFASDIRQIAEVHFNSMTLLKSYGRKVSVDLLRQAVEKYAVDFDIFGYDKEIDLK